jgi:DNA-binding CsgD family transcriptional regulator
MKRVSSPQLVGRDADLALLHEAAERAQDALPTVALVQGEAGIGKTRLLQEFLENRRERGATVLTGRCVEVAGAELPYAPVIAVLRDLLRQVGRQRFRELAGPTSAAFASWLPDMLEPAHSGGTLPGSDRGGLFDAVVSLLERLAVEQLVVVAIDDLHWADTASMDLLGYLSRATRQAHLLVVGTLREEAAADPALTVFIAELARLPTTEQLRLRRLTEAEVGEQLAGITGGWAAGDMVARIAALSDGVPFAVEELVRAAWSASGGAVVPQRLAAIMSSRLGLLSAPARRLLEAASLADVELVHPLLAAVVATDGIDVDAAVGEVVANAVLVVEPARMGYRFRHALLRAAVSDTVLPGDRIRWHACWGRAIDEHPDAVDIFSARLAVAHHWQRAGVVERAFDATVAAAQLCGERHLFAEQAALLGRLLGWWGQVTDPAARSGCDRSRVVDDLLEGLQTANDWQQMVTTIDIELSQRDLAAQPVRRALLQLRRLVAHVSLAGRHGGSPTELEAAEAALDGAPATRDLVLALTWAAWLDQSRSRFRGLAERAVAAAGEVGDPSLELGARAVRAESRHREHRQLRGGDADAPLGASERAVEEFKDIIAQDHLLPFDAMWTPVCLALILVDLGRLEEALTCSEDSRARLNDPPGGARWQTQAGFHVELLVMVGRWDEAQELLDQARSRPQTSGLRTWLDTLAGLMSLWRGGPRVAAVLADTARLAADELDSPAFDPRACRCWLRAELAAGAGDVHGVRAALAPVWSASVDLVDYDENKVRKMLLVAVRAEVEAAGRARALRDQPALDTSQAQVDALRRVDARDDLFTGPVGVALRTHFAAEASRWDGTEAPEPWLAAVDAWQSVGHPHERARALLRLAETQAYRLDNTAAQASLREAHTIATDLRAQPLVEEITALARRARLRLEPPRRAAQPQAEPSPLAQLGLTPRETEVLTLLVDGYTNAQIGAQLFTSAKTASVHVTNILRKLGVINRIQAAVVGARLGIATGQNEATP